METKHKVMRNRFLICFKSTHLLALVLFFCSWHSQAQLKISANASAEGVFQDISSEENENRSLSTLSIKPKINASYQSRTFKGLWQAKVTYLERGRDEESVENTYSEYNYTANWAPFGEGLTLQASGALNYQNAQAANFLVSDFFTNADALTKSRSNRFAVNTQLQRAKWARGSGSVSYSYVESEPSVLIAQRALNNDTYQISGELFNGKDAEHLIWNLTGSYQNTDNSQSDRRAQGDFMSRNASGFADIHVFANWALRLTGRHEGNQISSSDDTAQIVRTFNSYGAGITYRQSENRYVSITSNLTDSDIESDDNLSFVGIDLKWALTSRTNFDASYGRRFFGETASASLSYNSKYFRTAFRYSEDLTNASRLLANPENLGVFVCPASSISISRCFQPNSLNYAPQADEQFVQLTNQNIEINDNIIIRKTSNFQLGYDFSRVKIGVSSLYSEDDALDQDRLTRTYSLGTDLSFLLSRKTNLNISVEYASITQRSETLNSGDSDNWNTRLSLEHDINESLSFNSSLEYIKRSGDDILVGGLSNNFFGANFENRRLSVGLVYSYN